MQKEREETKLQSLVNSLSVKDRERIYNDGLLLLEDQNKVQDNSCLPTLTVSDINKTTPTTTLIHEDHGIRYYILHILTSLSLSFPH